MLCYFFSQRCHRNGAANEQHTYSNSLLLYSWWRPVISAFNREHVGIKYNNTVILWMMLLSSQEFLFQTVSSSFSPTSLIVPKHNRHIENMDVVDTEMEVYCKPAGYTHASNHAWIHLVDHAAHFGWNQNCLSDIIKGFGLKRKSSFRRCETAYCFCRLSPLFLQEKFIVGCFHRWKKM